MRKLLVHWSGKMTPQFTLGLPLGGIRAGRVGIPKWHEPCPSLRLGRARDAALKCDKVLGLARCEAPTSCRHESQPDEAQKQHAHRAGFGHRGRLGNDQPIRAVVVGSYMDFT